VWWYSTWVSEAGGLQIEGQPEPHNHIYIINYNSQPYTKITPAGAAEEHLYVHLAIVKYRGCFQVTFKALGAMGRIRIHVLGRKIRMMVEHPVVRDHNSF
jgi:hypothetical protein